LQVGIIGLGRRWRRYRPALHALRDRMLVRVVCDQRPPLAERAARQLGCAAAAGPIDLLDRAEVEAALLLDDQWFGLWPLEQAVRLGKPVFCAVPLACDDAHADDVMRKVKAAGLPVMAAPAAALSPALMWLPDLLAARLGAPRLVKCDWYGRGLVRPAGAPGALPALMYACAGLIGGDLVSVHATAAPAAQFVGVLMEFAGGQAAHLNLWTAARPACRFQVVTDIGDATAELPRTLHWHDGEGGHTIQAPRRSTRRLLLERFLDALCAGTPPEPCLEDAYRALLWARAAQRSVVEGRRVAVDPYHVVERPA
jgi:predicted dehydrogenase